MAFIASTWWYFHTHHQFNIEAQNLNSALLEMAVQARVRIMFSPETVKSHNCPKIQSRMSLESALEIALANTNIQYVYSSDYVLILPL